MTSLSHIIHELLYGPHTATIQILRAPPGEGKTRHTMRALLQAIADGRYHRVLWSVRQTLQPHEDLPKTLAQEAVEIFTEFSHGAVTPRILLGHEQFREDEEHLYRAQFVWDTTVLIISHAHLPLIYRPDHTGGMSILRGADLLIIDEDPLSSLLLQTSGEHTQTRAWPLKHLLTQLILPTGAPSATSLLHQFAQGQDDSGVWQDHVREIRQIGRKSSIRSTLRGAGFWAVTGPALVRLMTSAEAVDQLQVSLSRHFTGARPTHRERLRAQRDARAVIHALQVDVQRYRQGQFTHRFGWEWTGACHDAQPKALHFDLLRPVQGFPRTIVLDAYANLAQYQQLFAGRACELVCPPSAPTALRVHVAPTLRIDRTDLRYGRNRAKHELIIQDIHRDAERTGRPQLLLAPKNSWAVLRPWITTTNVDCAPHTQLEYAHWYAGRGKNAYAGWDVRALTCPHLPTQYRDAHLAALYPFDEQHGERSALWTHHKRSELLQMLLRSRQLQAAPGATPRLITHFLPCELCPEQARASCQARDETHPSACEQWDGSLELQPYQSAVLHREDSRNPKYRETLSRVTQEFQSWMPGVPLLALEVMGLVKIRANGAQTQADLRAALKTMLAWQTSSATPHVTAWQRTTLTTPPEWSEPHTYWKRYGTEVSNDRNRDALRDVFSLPKFQYRRYRIKTEESRILYTVFAPDPRQASKALGRLLPHATVRRTWLF